MGAIGGRAVRVPLADGTLVATPEVPSDDRIPGFLAASDVLGTGWFLHGGPAPVRRFLPELIDLISDGTIDPGRVFDLSLPFDEVAEGYRSMNERRPIKSLLRF